METAEVSSYGSFISNAHALLNSGFDLGALRANSLLRKDEWLRVDETVVEVARHRLAGIADLVSAGLTRDLGGLGVMMDEFEKVSDMTPAQQDMSGITPGEEDAVEFSLHGVPIPITHKDFRINVRHLEASRTRGSSLDLTYAQTATRQVVETLEDMLFNGSTVQMNGRGIAGYTTFADRVTGNLTGASGWQTGGTTGEIIVSDVLSMISAGEAQNFFGPWKMYVSHAYMHILRDDYKANSDKTILQRLLEIDTLSSIGTSGRLGTHDVLLVQMTSDVVDLSIGQDISTVEWSNNGGMQVKYKILAAMAPRLKSDFAGRCGIIHYDLV